MSNPFVHIELNTDDLALAKKFYKSVFDWKLYDMSGYTMIEVGKGVVGGGMQKKRTAQAPTSWLPYVHVDDVKKTVVKAQKAGAEVEIEYVPIGEFGAIGVFVDSTGAALGVWEVAKKIPKNVAAKKKR